MCLIVIFVLATLFSVPGYLQDIKGFDDTVLYKLDWPGYKTDFLEPHGSETMFITTAQKEQFKCIVPSLKAKPYEGLPQYDGPTAIEILDPLFTQSACSYRIESYWTYQLCHGKYVKQYHEEREGKKVKSQEYYLGKWNAEQQDILIKSLNAAEKSKDKLKTTKIEGANLPYVELVMTDGTLCDLSNKPRSTRILYVCHANGKHEVYSLKETSTCEYEVVVLSPLLCHHPQYKPQDSGEHLINCLPLHVHGQVKPQSVSKMEFQSLEQKYHQQRISEMTKEVVAAFKVEKNQDGETHVRLEIHPVDIDEKVNLGKVSSYSPGPKDTTPVEAFLAGENCLTGDSGWWKYEFCYGRSVQQFHIESDGRRKSVLLGMFNKEEHLAWLEQNPHKKPKPPGQRIHLSHLYSGGSVCDKTGRLRQTEVKLKCLEDSSPSSVSLYLLEPKTCEYILGVESPLICDILQKADSNGLIDNINGNKNELTENREGVDGKATEKFELKFEND